MKKIKAFFKSFSKKEKIVLKTACISLAIGVIIGLLSFYFSSTSIQPAEGGKFVEGVVGEVSSLNPVIVSPEEPAWDVIELVYSGILKPDNLNKKFVCDLCEKIETSSDLREWKVFLKRNVFWHDGEPFDSEDVLFTIEKILDEKTNSPFYWNWQGVVVKCLDSYTIEFYLKNPYPFFEESLSLLKIIPKHIWSKIKPQNYYLSEYNLLPVGTGPYIVKSYQKTNKGEIVGFSLEKNQNYFEKPPYLKEIEFRFYENFKQAIRALNQGKIKSLGNLSPFDFNQSFYGKRKLEIKTPRFFLVFLNPELNPIFKDKKIRKALLFATNKKEIVKKIGLKETNFSNTPFFEGMEGYFKDFQKDFFDLEKAKKILTEDNFKDLDNDGVLEKEILDEETKEKKILKLEFELILPQSDLLFQVANILKEQWQKTGFKVNLKTLEKESLSEEISQRNFETLLFGQMLTLKPDLFSFWHSSQIFEPGQNISLYENQEIDNALEKIREMSTKEEREKWYHQFQELFIEESPGIYLFWYPYFWIVPKDIKGIKIESFNFPFERFVNIISWYEKTVRRKK